MWRFIIKNATALNIQSLSRSFAIPVLLVVLLSLLLLCGPSRSLLMVAKCFLSGMCVYDFNEYWMFPFSGFLPFCEIGTRSCWCNGWLWSRARVQSRERGEQKMRKREKCILKNLWLCGTELIQRWIFKARTTVNIYIRHDQKWNRSSYALLPVCMFMWAC